MITIQKALYVIQKKFGITYSMDFNQKAEKSKITNHNNSDFGIIYTKFENGFYDNMSQELIKRISLLFDAEIMSQSITIKQALIEVALKIGITVSHVLLEKAEKSNITTANHPPFGSTYGKFEAGVYNLCLQECFDKLCLFVESSIKKQKRNLSISLKELVSFKFDHMFSESPWGVKSNKDELKGINNWCFETEIEAGLAAMMWIAIPDDKKNQNDFKHQFKYTLRMLGIDSVWAK